MGAVEGEVRVSGDVVCAACSAAGVLWPRLTQWDDDEAPVSRLVCVDAKACNRRRRRRPGRPFQSVVDGPGVSIPAHEGGDAATGRTGAGNGGTW